MPKSCKPGNDGEDMVQLPLGTYFFDLFRLSLGVAIHRSNVWILQNSSWMFMDPFTEEFSEPCIRFFPTMNSIVFRVLIEVFHLKIRHSCQVILKNLPGTFSWLTSIAKVYPSQKTSNNNRKWPHIGIELPWRVRSWDNHLFYRDSYPYLYTHIHIHTHTHIYIYIHTHIYTYTRVCVHLSGQKSKYRLVDPSSSLFHLYVQT